MSSSVKKIQKLETQTSPRSISMTNDALQMSHHDLFCLRLSTITNGSLMDLLSSKHDMLLTRKFGII